MKRKIIDQLILWKNSNSGKPILLTGAKGVGKTYLAYDFAKAFFEGIFYINFERDSSSKNLFSASDPSKIKEQILNYFSITMESLPKNRILILDEINFAPDVIECMNLLQKSRIFPYIVAISSNPLQSNEKAKFHSISVYPLEFDEFLRATGYEWYIETIMNHFESNQKIPEIVHTELLTLHELYLQIGGMPGMINEYQSLSSVVNISEQHSLLISSYHDYILKDNQESDALKMNQVFDSLALQLMKENKKFQYKLIRKGTTHLMYKDAIKSLVDRNYVIMSNKISNELLQSSDNTFLTGDWSNNTSNSNFKLYLPDTGMLSSKMMEEKVAYSETDKKKALLENFVAQSLQAKGYQLSFWESDSMAKIDFIINKNQALIPIEIHSSDNTRSKSISVFKQKYEFPYAIKISSKNFDYSNQIKYVPYYAVFCI